MSTRTLALAATLFVASTASAADHEVSVEWGTLFNGDPAFDAFSAGDWMPSRGVRAGVAVHDRVAVVAGFHRARRGASMYTPDGEWVADSAHFANEWTLGAKADLEITEFLLPYVAPQFLLYQGQMRFDDDRTDRDNAGQVRLNALAPGALFVGGVEVRIPKDEAPFTLALHIEAGYGLVARHTYDHGVQIGPDGPEPWENDGTVATMRPGGFVFRTGLGVRF